MIIKVIAMVANVEDKAPGDTVMADTLMHSWRKCRSDPPFLTRPRFSLPASENNTIAT